MKVNLPIIRIEKHYSKGKRIGLHSRISGRTLDGRLFQSIFAIDHATEVIRAISEQTNLLTLNVAKQTEETPPSVTNPVLDAVSCISMERPSKDSTKLSIRVKVLSPTHTKSRDVRRKSRRRAGIFSVKKSTSRTDLSAAWK